MKYNLLFICLFISIKLSAEMSTLTIPAMTDAAIDLRPHLQIYTDNTNALGVEEVRRLQKSGAFQPFDEYEFEGVLERGKYTYWFYLAVDYLPVHSEEVIIRGFGGTTLNLFQFKNEQLRYTILGGSSTPATDTASVAYYKSDLPVTLSKGNTTFLVKYTNDPTHYLSGKNIRLIKASTGLHIRNKGWIIYYSVMGLFFGGLLFVLITSIAQYFQVKDNTFLFYAIYVLSLLIYYWRFYAMDNPFFRMMSPIATATEYYTLFNLPIYFTYLLFLRAFIRDIPSIPHLRKAIRLFLCAIISYFIIERTAMFFSLNWAYRVEKFGRPLFLIFGLGLLISLFRANRKGAIKYILYGTFALLGMVLLGLLISGFNPYWYSYNIANSFTQLGILIELICFSLGLGAQAKVIAQEKKAAQLALQIQQQAAENLQQLNQLKSRFFTNITHEFRTPLTVIKGISQQIQSTPNKDLNRRTDIIQSNVDNLLEMVNQLLDLSKTDFNQYQIKNSQQDIIKYLSYLTDSFHSLAYTKKINLSFHSQIDQQLMDFDPKIVQTLVVNLLGNALKFTPQYGKIKVVASMLSKERIRNKLRSVQGGNSLILEYDKTLEKNEKDQSSSYLSIKVQDTGFGIAAKHLPHIFDRFYQVDASDVKKNYGSGIGLALIKELMELIGGIILVSSEENNGTTVQLFLPIKNNATLKNRAAESYDLEKKGGADSDPLTTIIPRESVYHQSSPLIKKDSPLLLIVEDNADVVYYLKDCLTDSYDILAAPNGKDGLELAFQQIPDLIISDVMMPEMGGFELCEHLKKDIRTSHIPIILLTAKVESESKYKGLESGADAYLAKPFDKIELLLRLENLLLLKKQIQLHLQLNEHTIANKNIAVSPTAAKELAFIQQLRSTVQQHLHNEFFKAPQLAKAMMMSQTQLYRKIKALLNQSTAQYIKTIRLEKAKDLLEMTDFSIGRIATEVGFKTQAHFSKSFQEEFGQNPSKIRK